MFDYMMDKKAPTCFLVDRSERVETAAMTIGAAPA